MMTIRDLIFDVPAIFNRTRFLLHQGFTTEREFVRAHIKPADRVLDFGCGTGQYSELFNPRTYVGIDLPTAHLRYARKRYPDKTFVVFDENFNVPCESHSFDWVFCIAVVHHVPPGGIETFRGEILRVLKPGGSVLIWDPVPVSHQSSAWSKFLLSIDRGRFPRLPESVLDAFGDAVQLRERASVKAGPYDGYLLVLEKKE